MSAWMEIGLYSGKIATIFVPCRRAAVTKCASGMRVSRRFEPHIMIYFELNQSAASHVSVCTPHVIGSPGGRSETHS
ncbi:Uncharacterised protein [uncultured archaeon]|nr:Uncharacterised protein [uncultured archaeon]